ncbi:hypothetical protein GCM10010970_01400 [Silvimonas iriomotensis]|uniref:Trypsin-like peptidase domain-containing protein n=2 Tax=Silvimonas iriomotensis TaxID=449662 RepID=A0ABQ2P465_9NEIS|nr:hypothetical protein GCM10010970_01400 [Silvimonas iriomotensis]
MIDENSNHFPDRIEIELHIDPINLTQSMGFSIPLYRNGVAVWRQGTDSAGEVDVAVIELEQAALPAGMVYRAFTPDHLFNQQNQITLGSSVLVVGFPLGVHDTLHHMPVVRHAIVASGFGLRFQGKGYFLTDGRTHRGTSGAPVVLHVIRNNLPDDDFPWLLLGVHSSRIDVGSRDLVEDEHLGLNATWYADILLTLTNP